MEFNRIIKLLRKERGITQKQAAEDLGGLSGAAVPLRKRHPRVRLGLCGAGGRLL